MNNQELVIAINAISKQAGAAILEVYQRNGDIAVKHKEDDSPLTEADLAAHGIIQTGLQELNLNFPILSEESESINWEERRRWQTYWLVDPLDGTKEFINRNDEFTVNIALIDRGVPVLGVVYVPVLDVLYYGSANEGAFKESDGVTEAIHAATIAPGQKTLRVLLSRSHRGETLDRWIARAEEEFEKVELISMGSSLKICLLAEGKADIYPRLSLTSEWDTAAAQAILEAAGGTLTNLDQMVYRYNRKDNILNPFFYAFGDYQCLSRLFD